MSIVSKSVALILSNVSSDALMDIALFVLKRLGVDQLPGLLYAYAERRVGPDVMQVIRYFVDKAEKQVPSGNEKLKFVLDAVDKGLSVASKQEVGGVLPDLQLKLDDISDTLAATPTRYINQAIEALVEASTTSRVFAGVVDWVNDLAVGETLTGVSWTVYDAEVESSDFTTTMSHVYVKNVKANPVIATATATTDRNATKSKTVRIFCS